VSTSGTGLGGNFGDGEAAAMIAGEDLLGQDSIPDTNQKMTCFSCDQQMLGVFCHACGQKNDDYRRSIFSLITETFASVFSLENRIWRTWLSLIIKPGKASREFADGKRTVWTSPVRIYLAMSIILFGYMSLTETRIFSVRTDIVAKSGITGDVDKLDDQSVRLKPTFGFFKRQAELDRLNANLDFNRVSRLMEGTPKQAFVYKDNLALLGVSLDDENLKTLGLWPELENSTPLGEATDQDLAELNKAARIVALSNYNENIEDVVDLYNSILGLTASPETVIDRIRSAKEKDVPFDIFKELNPSLDETGIASTLDSIEILDSQLAKLGLSRESLHVLPDEIKRAYTFNMGAGTMNGVSLSQTEVKRVFVQVLRNPAVLNEGVSKYLPRIMFLMMPFAAIIGLVFIRSKKNALLYDHLVHAAYIHAVTYGFLLVLILLSQWTSLKATIGIFLIGILVYLPLSAKRMFNRGWFKTVLASYSIAFNYGLVLFFVVILLTAQSIVDQADLIQQL
jgi:hypothetical protein